MVACDDCDDLAQCVHRGRKKLGFVGRGVGGGGLVAGDEGTEAPLEDDVGPACEGVRFFADQAVSPGLCHGGL